MFVDINCSDIDKSFVKTKTKTLGLKTKTSIFSKTKTF